jgi:hypothetical protein
MTAAAVAIPGSSSSSCNLPGTVRVASVSAPDRALLGERARTGDDTGGAALAPPVIVVRGGGYLPFASFMVLQAVAIAAVASSPVSRTRLRASPKPPQ